MRCAMSGVLLSRDSFALTSDGEEENSWPIPLQIFLWND